MECPSEIGALRLPLDEIGVVKEGPVIRWLTGLQVYNKKYSRQAKKAIKTRQYNERKAQMLVEKARNAGILQDDTRHGTNDELTLTPPNDVLGLDGENPPPSAICGRRDTVSVLRARGPVLLNVRIVSC